MPRQAKSKSLKPTETALPAGFKPIEHIGNFWRGETKGDKIEGVLVRKSVKHFQKNGKYKARDVNVYIIKTGAGKEVEVRQSGGLGALEQVKPKQRVCILFVGMKKLKGKADMREYLVGVR